MTLLDMFARSVHRVPDRSAFRFRNRRVRCRELDAVARIVGVLLRRAGARPEERVVPMLPNLPEFGAGYLGILMAGAAVVPLNPLLKAEEVRYVLQDSGATAMLCL